MSRWIDADAAIREIAEKGYDKAQTNEAFEAVNDACDIIFYAPSIDLVRCAECKYHYGEYCFRLVSKEAWIVLGSQCVITMQPDDFCSYGCRKESE